MRKLDSEAAAARIAGIAVETPVLAALGLLLKLENRQHTGSFKLRGAANKLLALSEADRARGVVAASTGNHGAAVAHAAAQLGCRASVFAPETAAASKLEKIRRLGAEVVLVPGDSVESERAARRHALRHGVAYVSPYNDEDVVEGQGTVAVELLRQVPALGAVYVALGGGGLVAGVGLHFKERGEATEVVAVSPERSPVMHESLRQGRILEMEVGPTLSDGTVGGVEEGSITFELCRRAIDRSLLVTEEEIAAAMRAVFQATGEVIEGAAGVAVAGALRERSARSVAVVVCGGNVTPDVWNRAIS